MTGEQHTAIIQKIQQNVSDQATVTTALAELSSDYSQTLATLSDSELQLEAIKIENEKLRKANLDLFLQVGTTKAENKATEADEEKLSYDDLYDENGGIK